MAADLKLIAWEVLREGSLKSGMNGGDVERAAARGISNKGMTCVRFLAQEEKIEFELKVVLDVPPDAPVEHAIEEARKLVIARRINID